MSKEVFLGFLTRSAAPFRVGHKQMRNRIIAESSIHFTLAFWLLVLLLIKLSRQGIIIFKTLCIFSHFRCKEL